MFAKLRLAVVATVLGFLPLSALPAPGDRNGSEVTVNSSDTGAQYVDVALDADGNFVAVWQGTGGGVYLRRFAANGAPLDGQAQPYSTASGFQGAPSVARAPGGNFVVTWQGGGAGGDSSAAFMRLFNGAGVPLTPVTMLHEPTQVTETGTNAAMAPDGSFVVIWRYNLSTGGQLLARRFDASGAAQGGTIVVEALSGSGVFPEFPAVAMDDDGNFVVAWEAPDGSGDGVWMRRYSANGVAAGPRVAVNTTTVEAQSGVGVSMNDSGRFVIAWTDCSINLCDVVFRRYSAAGAPLGGETTAHDPNTKTQGFADVTIDANGNFAVIWASYGLENPANQFDQGMYGRRFSADGISLGAQFHVNTSTTNNQGNGHVGGNARGAFVAIWESAHLSTSSRRPMAQSYEGQPPPPEVDLSAVIVDLTDPVATDRSYEYRVTLTNNDALDAATGVTATVTGTDGVVLAPGSGDGWSCSGTGPVDCTLGAPLAPGATATFTVAATAPASPGTVSASVSADAIEPDPNGANDDDTESTTVVAADSVPDAFNFTDRTGLATGKIFRSNTITVSGITVPTPISITGPSTARYQVNDGLFTLTPGTVNNGDLVRIELRTATRPDTPNACTLDIGGVTDRWVVRTGEVDGSPDIPTFVDVTGAARDTTVTSNSVTLAGFNTPVTVSIIGGAATGELSLNGAPFGRDPVTANPGDTLRLRVLSGNSAGAKRLVKIKLGTTTDQWVVRSQ